MTTPSVTINGIPGVTHGDYGPPRTWIDWWFKKGDVMICLNLQSVKFPYTEPTQSEKDEHKAIIASLKYCRDFPSDMPPAPDAYDPAKYPVGTMVRVATRAALEDLLRSWKLHNKLQPNQLEFAERTAKVKRSYMYHGGDILYELEDVPGVWHEQCLELAK